MISRDTFLPIPPCDAVPNAALVHGVTVFYVVALTAALLWALVNCRRPRGQLMLLLLPAGAIAALCEPLLDIIGAAWYPHIGIPVAFELMGRPIPVWTVLAYTFFFGAVGWFTVTLFQRGVTQRQAWLIFLIPIAIDIIQQEILLHFQLLMYYGNQPLVLINKFPFWWAPCDSFGNFLAAAIFYRLLPWVRGWKTLALPLVYPIADFIGYAAVSLVGFTVVNSELPNWVTQLAGLVSWILAVPFVWLVARMVAVDSPWATAFEKSADNSAAKITRRHNRSALIAEECNHVT
jgi:hypothetical protein